MTPYVFANLHSNYATTKALYRKASQKRQTKLHGNTAYQSKSS